jgi:transcriptional regulator with XRE-family HTH domain
VTTKVLDPEHPLSRFGRELRRHREARGLTIEQLAKTLPFSASLVGAVERAQRRPGRDFVEYVEEELGLSGELAELLPPITKEGSPTWFRPWTKIEETASSLWTWEPLLVPGLLQTEEYARAVFAAEPGTTPDEVDQAVAARLQRQAIFQRPRPPIFSVTLDEAVLLRPVGGRAVMRKQLEHLLMMITEFRVTIQIVPLDAGFPVGLLGGFVIAQSTTGGDSVYFESLANGRVSNRADDVHAGSVRFNAIRAWAHPLPVSEALIRETLESKYGH